MTEPPDTAPSRPQHPLSLIRIPCRHPDASRLARIDEWFERALDIRIEALHLLPGKSADPQRNAGVELAWRFLLLFRELMQAARIPVFYPGQVIAIAPDRIHPASWVATAAITRIDLLPQTCYTVTRNKTLKLLHWISDNPRTPENTEKLYATVAQQILPAIQRRAPKGKSTLHVLRAAWAGGIPFIHLGAGVYQLGWGRRARKIDRSTTDGDAAIGAKLAQNKVWSATLARMAGLPAPQHGVATNIDEARKLASQIGWPLVIKPDNRDRGEGVTIGIRDDNQLPAALATAKAGSKNAKVIVEREVPGVCHRLFIAKGQLLYAVKRWPKSIHGDGHQTIAGLIATANQRERSLPPWRRTEPYPKDDEALGALRGAGFTLDSVPASGVRIPLRAIESTADGGFDEEVTHDIHPDNLDIALRAARLFNLEVAGIDIISADIRVPWHQNGAVINEVNFAPLLGGGEISRRHIPAYLTRLIEQDGRIPVAAVVGDTNAFDPARKLQQGYVERGLGCYLTSHDKTLSPAGKEITIPINGLFHRCRALQLDQAVEAIILVVQTDEWLNTGLPLDRLSQLVIAGNALLQATHPTDFRRLCALLKSMLPSKSRRGQITASVAPSPA